MSDNSQSDILPGSVSCIFCNKSVDFLNEGKDRFFNHLRDEHMIFLNHNVVLAINFLDKDTLQVIVEQFETTYFRIMDNENKKEQVTKVDQNKNVQKGKENKVDKKMKKGENLEAIQEIKPSLKVGSLKKEEYMEKVDKLLEKLENVNDVENTKKVERVNKLGNIKEKFKKIKKVETITEELKTTNEVDNAKDINVSKKNGKRNGLGKIKIINASLLQEEEKTIVVEDEKTIVVEDDKPLTGKNAKVTKKKTDGNKQNKSQNKSTLIKSPLDLVQKRKSVSSVESKNSSKRNLTSHQIRRQSFGGSKPTKRLNGSLGNKTLPHGLSIVKTLAKNSGRRNTNVLTGLEGIPGITVTKAVQPKPPNPSKVINLSTDNITQIKQIAKNGNLATTPGFSCGVCGKKFNTVERHKKHTATCIKSNINKTNIGFKKLSQPVRSKA